tara:strand:- start:374 stop:703 length:330 start_codon:yes stop_codon:yes gene_type:complete
MSDIDADKFGTIDIATGEYNPGWEGNKLADYKFIERHLKSLSGKILTVIDAAIPEGKQNKSIKDLIRADFLNKFTEVQDLLIDKNLLSGEDLSLDVGEIETVSAEEALK